MRGVDPSLLDVVFGRDSVGLDIASRARGSRREFVRSQSMLAVASPNAKGRRFSASEALDAFGFDVLLVAVSDGQAALVPNREEPARTLKKRREELGYDIAQLARLSKVDASDIVKAETPGKVVAIRTLNRLAPILALDERLLGFREGAGSDSRLGVRLRQLSSEDKAKKFSPTLVASLAEAAWIIERQQSLSIRLGIGDNGLSSQFIADYDYDYPTYLAGYRLAEQARSIIGLGRDDPILNIRRLIEDVLTIPLIEAPLGQKFAGATIANADFRGIVVNTEGANENVWVRRMTLAHELGHLLWDPTERLDRLMVDSYEDIERGGFGGNDPVEIRANAFAIAFLAPPGAVRQIVSSQKRHEDAVAILSDRYGISVTASRRHIQNVCRLDLSHLRLHQRIEPSTEWLAQEDGLNDFYPLAEVPQSRRGRFAWVTLRAFEENLISRDSAAAYLETTEDNIIAKKNDIIQVTAPKY